MMRTALDAAQMTEATQRAATLARRNVDKTSCKLTSKLPCTQQAPRSGILLLRVRAERNVRNHGLSDLLCFFSFENHR